MYYGSNRYICDVLEEMRTAYKTYNFAIMLSLIEEIQVMANRMESALNDLKDLNRLHDDIKSEKKILKKLKEEVAKLQEEKDASNIKD